MRNLILALATVTMMPFSAMAGTAAVDVDGTPVRVDVEVGPDHRRGGRRFVCFAENRRGQLFRAVGQNRNRVQRRAMNQCFRYSRQCRPLGCNRTR